MAHRILSSNLETSLLNNDAFAYAHLIKFERPTETESGRPAEKATDYSYIGDGSFDLTWDDGSSDIDGNLNGPQVYVANRVIKVGTVSETVKAKASTINVELSTVALNTTFTGIVSITASSIAANESLVDAGFAEGDVLKCTASGSNNGLTIRIDAFSNENKTAEITPINRTSIATDVGATYTLEYASDETIGILSKTNKFVNREVFIYKAHIDPATGSIVGDPYLLFKGIIASAKIKEDPSNSSKISWGVTSHWGDFVRVNGRSTSDSEHRALDGAGSSDLAALIRPEYASDLGFLHSEQSLNVMAVYQVNETRYKQKRRGGLAGALGGKKMVEYEVEVDREIDLRFNLEAQRLPVVYGVQRIDSFPIFVDTLKDNSNIVHAAYALCEGEIAGIYDIYVDDQSSICIDQNDNDTRSGSNTAEVVCTGRMDRGDTIAARPTYEAGSFAFYTGASYSWGAGALAWANRDGEDGVGTNNLFNYTPLDNIIGGVDVGNLGGSGITHEKGTSFNSPIPTELVVHTGKPFQRSSNTLSKIASDNNFKVQSDYFESTGDYWGPNHTLLDTAYVTAKFTIGEGESTIPELEFIVRGKMIDCYNYDNSYTKDYVFSDTLTEFSQGDIVTIKNTAGDATLSTVTIADIESYKNENGGDIFRVRFQDDLNLGSATAFYMTDGVNNYHFTTYNHTYATGVVASTLTGSTTWSDNATLDGVNAEVVVTGAMLTALIEGHSIGEVTAAELAVAYISFFSKAAVNTFEINASGNILENLGHVAGASAISSDVQVIVKDAIHLASSESSIDDSYTNLEIELVRTFADQSQHIQKRRITDYTGAQRVAIVDSPWDAGVIPQTGDTYRIISPGDKRVSTNPAIQLLDYITSTRYGRGLDVYKDINLDTFKQAARDCDTRSNVTMLLPSTANISVGDVYKYEDAATVLRFQGTVESVSPDFAISGTYYKEIEFKDVIGKIATKWADWKYFLDGELVWYSGGVYAKSGDGYLAPAPTGASVAVSISKVFGAGDATISVDVDSTRKTFDGNSIVKKWKSSSKTFQSGYSLYDSDDVKYWRYLGWNDSNQRYVTRHQTNAVIDTNNSVFQNINNMLAHFNGILRYSNGKYDLVIKKATDTFEAAQYITDDDIIGSINVEDAGQKNTYNSVSVGIPDPQNRYETRSVSFFDSTFLKKDRNVPKKGDIKTPYITNYFNARINARQYLEESRKSLKIAFKMEPKGLLLTAGSLIKVSNKRFGWVEEEFRITNLNFQGNCLVDVTAEQHSQEAYLIKNLSKAAYVPGEVAGQAEPVLSSPFNLQVLDNNEKGGTRLGWTNSTSYKTSNHTVEIYRGLALNNMELVATAKGSEFTDPVLTPGTYYYWVRYSIVVDGTRTFFSASSNSITATVEATLDGDSYKEAVLYQNAPDSPAPAVPTDTQGFNTTTGAAEATGSWTVNNSTPVSPNVTWKAVVFLKQANSQGDWAVEDSWVTAQWSGDQGIQGTQGPQGIQGIQGTRGPQGPQGITGTQGPQGIQGTRGLQGPQGTQGITGTQGPQGIQGTRGPQGIQGITGTQGPQGIQGTQGTRGPQGIQGITGTQGPQGLQGTRGPQGLQGITGTQGPQGITGTQGPQGLQGTIGPQGPQGITGTQGPQGITGATGPQGVTGTIGPTGPAGAAGNAIAFDVDGTTDDDAGKSFLIRAVRGSNDIIQNDVYWDIINGSVFQYLGPDLLGSTATVAFTDRTTSESGILNLNGITDIHFVPGSAGNIGIGEGAIDDVLPTSTLAINNVGIGYNVLTSSFLNGESNVGIGNQALLGVSTGAHNIALGTAAAWRLGEGDNNIALGFWTLGGLYGQSFGGNDNTAIGYRAFSSIQYGSRNLAIGTSTSTGLLQGYDNLVLGSFSGSFLKSSNDNILLGVPSYASGAAEMSYTVQVGGDKHLDVNMAELVRADKRANNVVIGGGAGSSLPPGPQFPSGTNIINNGVPNGTTTGWSTLNVTNFIVQAVATLDYSSGGFHDYLQFTPGTNPAVSRCIYQAVNTVVGATYTVTAIFRRTTSDPSYPLGKIYIGTSAGTNSLAESQYTLTSGNERDISVVSCTFVATGTSTYVSLFALASGIHQWREISAVRVAARNVILGQDTATSLTTGSDNIAIGTEAGRIISSGIDNICIGNNSGGMSTGFNNITIGRDVSVPYSSSYSNGTFIGNSDATTFWINGLNGLAMRYNAQATPATLSSFGESTLITSTGYVPFNRAHRISFSASSTAATAINSYLYRRIGTGAAVKIAQIEILPTGTNESQAYFLIDTVAEFSNNVYYIVTARSDTSINPALSTFGLTIEKIG